MSEKIEFDVEEMTVDDDRLTVFGDGQQVILACDYTGRVLADHFRNGFVIIHVQANGTGVVLEYTYR